jgi:hypothetical protein
MERETVEQILKSRNLLKAGDEYSMPENEVATLLIGQGQISALPGVVSFKPRQGYLLVRTNKGTETFVEYELVRALSFESKEVADRRTGFV